MSGARLSAAELATLRRALAVIEEQLDVVRSCPDAARATVRVEEALASVRYVLDHAEHRRFDRH